MQIYEATPDVKVRIYIMQRPRVDAVCKPQWRRKRSDDDATFGKRQDTVRIREAFREIRSLHFTAGWTPCHEKPALRDEQHVMLVKPLAIASVQRD